MSLPPGLSVRFSIETRAERIVRRIVAALGILAAAFLLLAVPNPIRQAIRNPSTTVSPVRRIADVSTPDPTPTPGVQSPTDA